jgi:anaerobic selenocysteine-containing dehydrogenase
MTSDGKINLVPELFAADLERLNRKRETAAPGGDGEFLLITRRTLRSINTWMHNSPRLVKGRHRCTLMINPDDARGKGLINGRNVRVASRVGGISVPLEVTDEMMPGVVSMPFGWGHDREGVKLSVASRHPGVSMNDVADEKLFDKVSGMSVLDGIPVNISKEEE